MNHTTTQVTDAKAGTDHYGANRIPAKKELIQREKQNERFSNYIRDVDRYTTDGKGTEYELPTGYQSASVSSLGKILLVNPDRVEPEPLDTSYETWTRLTRKKY